MVIVVSLSLLIFHTINFLMSVFLLLGKVSVALLTSNAENEI